MNIKRIGTGILFSSPLFDTVTGVNVGYIKNSTKENSYQSTNKSLGAFVSWGLIRLIISN